MEPASVAVEEIQQSQFVVAEHRVKLWLFDQRQGRERLRATVDQVADRHYAIELWLALIATHRNFSRRSPTAA